ncbi:alcohol dehydrogenase catalytic domain-containing protein [Actinopolymorpha rutila]|uniref:Alcohol dehydrogenase n=1 Tax=Actinopolymorpha rutila TaxID=446787 RepID=A0A852ZQT8_9ACTN|nr:alcohol dehydrogenase catalytic domain-containing protein [Actinopolymorpha rutila]NYH91779.1 alcohol dehydrogenase [Actinopolymorpha rutila]
MRAVWYDTFGGPVSVREVPSPRPAPHEAVVEVAATGVCRSDWHAWQGHDPDVSLPHVGGHEFAGVVAEVGAEVRGFRPGQRVTAPFVHACGRCAQCARGDHQICARQTQPGFTRWGSFAEYVVVDHADVNLVLLPDALEFTTAAGLGCRFGTAYRAVLRQGRVGAGDWVAVHGCGGAGLSAVEVAVAAGARVVAVDVSAAALDLARALGAAEVVDASIDPEPAAVASVVHDLTDGGARVSLDCLGSPATCAASVLGLARGGRHVQVGLLHGGATPVPMDRVVAYELDVVGSHGLPAHEYPAMLGLVTAGRLRPDRLVGKLIDLADVPNALAAMSPNGPRLGLPGAGMTVAVLSQV